MARNRSMGEIRRKRARKRRIIKIVAEFTGYVFVGAIIGIALLLAIAFDPYQPPGPPEHYNQIEYCDVWWDIDDYNAMMEEREAYWEEEYAKEQQMLGLSE